MTQKCETHLKYHKIPPITFLTPGKLYDNETGDVSKTDKPTTNQIVKQ